MFLAIASYCNFGAQGKFNVSGQDSADTFPSPKGENAVP